MPNTYGHEALQPGQMRQAMFAVPPETRQILEAYAAFGAASWAEILLDDLVRTVVCNAMPRWHDLVTGQGLAPASVAGDVYDRECWMREGARQLVLQILKAIHEAPGLLAQLQGDTAWPR